MCKTHHDTNPSEDASISISFFLGSSLRREACQEIPGDIRQASILQFGSDLLHTLWAQAIGIRTDILFMTFVSFFRL